MKINTVVLAEIEAKCAEWNLKAERLRVSASTMVPTTPSFGARMREVRAAQDRADSWHKVLMAVALAPEKGEQ